MTIVKRFLQNCYQRFAVRSNVVVGESVHVGIGSILWAPTLLTVGNDVYVGKRCTIECDGTIGNGVLIANNVGLVGRLDHDFRTIGVLVRSAPWVGDADIPGRRLKLVIGDDV